MIVQGDSTANTSPTSDVHSFDSECVHHGHEHDINASPLEVMPCNAGVSSLPNCSDHSSMPQDIGSFPAPPSSAILLVAHDSGPGAVCTTPVPDSQVFLDQPAPHALRHRWEGGIFPHPL